MDALVVLHNAGVAPVVNTGQDLREVLEAIASLQDRDQAPSAWAIPLDHYVSTDGIDLATPQPEEDEGAAPEHLQDLTALASAAVEIANLLGGKNWRKHWDSPYDALSWVCQILHNAGLDNPQQDEEPETFAHRQDETLAHAINTARGSA